MVDADMANVEMLMELMVRHELDEVTLGTITLKKSRHRSYVVPLDDGARAALTKHLEPLPNEPWNEAPQSDVDAWAEKGKVG